MTLERFELTVISNMLSVAAFSREIEDDKAFARIENKVSYGIISGCKSIAFDFSDREMACLDKVASIAVKNAQKGWLWNFGQIQKKVEEELKKRGLIEQDNATSTTSHT